MSESDDTTPRGVDEHSPECFALGCTKKFKTVDEMTAVPGGGGRSPRHFCESCAERLQRGPPIVTDGGSTQSADEAPQKSRVGCAYCGIYAKIEITDSSEDPNAGISHCPNCGSEVDVLEY